MPIYPSEQFRPGQPMPPRPQRPAQKSSKPNSDIRSTKEYKLAARRWTSTIVALPIVMYTSYILYERIYGGREQKKFAEQPEKKQGSE